MFNDKITKKIAESVKEVLEAKGESYFDSDIPPVAKRLPASALAKKKKTRKAIPIKKPDNTGKIIKAEAPVVRLGQGDYQKDYTEKNLGPAIDVPEKAKKLAGRVKGMALRLMGRKG